MSKKVASTLSITETPLTEKSLSGLLYYGPKRDPQADLFEALRGINSLLRAMFAAIDDDTGKFMLEDKVLSELLFITSNLVDNATTAADLWSDLEAEAREELRRRDNLQVD